VPTLVTDGVIKHLDYNITVSEGGNTVFNQKFHTHNGNLTLVFTPSSGQISVTGGDSDAAQTTTGPFYISGPVFNSTGNYDITADVVGVNFSPITPLKHKFTVQAVPEFGNLASIVLVMAITSIIIITAKTRVIQKL
jgi:predicted secreted protein with PEFG-CTERM motif